MINEPIVVKYSTNPGKKILSIFSEFIELVYDVTFMFGSFASVIRDTEVIVTRPFSTLFVALLGS